ncbi:hypothetical protein PIB30_023268 [Stylosanthes scabra]|uniref:Uncharacterized protein n=1 Tax=Stylosanthes scabra TaxID=79078 RepID=A0ABU6Z9U0_9FABA|nr:hypothetical protein [Stylosanthes scabra]
MTHKKRDCTYIYEDALTIVQFKKLRIVINHPRSELSQNDSLSRVLGKEQPGRVRGVGTGPSPTQIVKHGTHQTNFESHVDVEEYKREIMELKEKAAEEKKKR